MSLLTNLYTRVVELTNRINAIGANSKVTEEMPLMNPVDRSALIRLSKNGTSYKATLNDLIDEIEIQDGVVQIGVIEIIDHLGGKALRIAELPNPKWRINGLVYTKTSETIIPIPFASTDKHRIDIFVGNEFSEIQRIQGVEDDNVGIPPAIPENTVEITRINIFGETIEDPELPSEVGYITKSSKKYRGIVLNDIPPKTLLLSAEYTTFDVKNSAGSGEIKGFISLVSPSGTGIHDGLDVYIRNNSEPTITLLHDDSSVLIPFYFSDEEDLSIGFNQIAHLKYNQSLERVELVNVMGETFDPSDYDLDEFQNASLDPYVRESEITTSTWQEVIDASVVGGKVEVEFPTGVKITDINGGLTFKASVGQNLFFESNGALLTSIIYLSNGLLFCFLKNSNGTAGQTIVQGADGAMEWGDLPTPDDFEPSEHDLDEFQNGSEDPFVRESEIPEPTPTPNLQQVTDAGFTTHNPIAFSEFGSTKKAHFSFDSIKLSEGEGMGLINKGTLFYPFPKSALIPETLATQEWTREQSNFTTQTIDTGGNYNDLEVTADLLIFTNENAQAILNGVWGRKEFHILNLSTTYGLRINHDSSSVTDPSRRIKLPTAGGSVDIKGTARVLQTDDYGYFVADTWASKYRPEFTGLTETEVITVDPNSNADTMPMRELYVYRDSQTTAMTEAELNIAYPNATRPFQVICKELNLIYLKEDDVNNIWTAIPLVQNDFPKLHTIKKTFTGVEVGNWDTAPLELIPPVGAGYLIDVISAHHIARNATGFSEDPYIRYSDVIEDDSYWRMQGLNYVFNQVLEFKEIGGYLKSIGAGLVLTGNGGVMDGELDVYITYQIKKL